MESTNYNDSDYKEIKPHAFFTTQAEKILNFHDNTPLDYLDGWALEELNSILSIDVPPKTKEEYLMKTMLDDEFKQRVVTKSFFTHEKDNEIVPYFQVEGNKKKLPKRIEDVGIDFELVAENLFKNFLNLSLF